MDVNVHVNVNAKVVFRKSMTQCRQKMCLVCALQTNRWTDRERGRDRYGGQGEETGGSRQ